MSTSLQGEFILKLNDRKQVTAKEYKGFVYFHVYDALKHKSVSLTSDEVKRLYKKMPKLLKVAKEILKANKDSKKRKGEGKSQKKDEKDKESIETSTSSSDTDEDGGQMEESE